VPGRVGNRDVELFWEEFADSAILCVVRFWIPTPEQRAFLQARSEAVERIKAAFDSNGITIPFPIRTLDLSGLDARLMERLASPAAPPDGEEEHERRAGALDERESAG
jgi:small conductance mechanosensitive channel